MAQFQLCLLAAFMLLLSNCVAEYAMGTTEVHSHYDTPQSAIINKHKGMPHSHEIQRRFLGTQARFMSGEQDRISSPPQRESEKDQLQEKTQTPKESSGEVAGSKGTQTQTENTPNGSSDSNTINGGAGAHVSQHGSPDSPKDKRQGSLPETKGGQEDSSRTKTGPNGKKGDSPPAPDVSATESTTTEPAAEGDHTAGSSDSTSTSTHSPTDTVKSSDSHAAVKAGALSFILSIGIVLALFM